MDKDKGLKLLNSFYYLAPLWFLLETFFWPGFRAGPVTGGGHWATAGFYTVEAGLGAALWFRLPGATAAALLENVAYLVLLFKYILFAPADAALALDADGAGIAAFAKSYSAAMPGMLYSAAHVVLKIQGQLGSLGRPG